MYKDTMIKEWAARVGAFFDAIASGQVRLTSEVEPQEVYAGHIDYVAHGDGYEGWQLSVFNDCGRWDYASSLDLPDGEAFFDEEQIEEMLQMTGHAPRPDPAVAWERYGIPGFRKLEEQVWSGYALPRTEEMQRRLDEVAAERQLAHPTLVALRDALVEGSAVDQQQATEDWVAAGCPMFSDAFDTWLDTDFRAWRQRQDEREQECASCQETLRIFYETAPLRAEANATNLEAPEEGKLEHDEGLTFQQQLEKDWNP